MSDDAEAAARDAKVAAEEARRAAEDAARHADKASQEAEQASRRAREVSEPDLTPRAAPPWLRDEQERRRHTDEDLGEPDTLPPAVGGVDMSSEQGNPRGGSTT